MRVGRVSNVLVLGAVLLLGGCAVGNTVDYQAATPPVLEIDSDQDVVVAVLDQRPYVLDGDKGPDFVGVRRAGFGNPWDVTTRSAIPFADEMASAIVEGLTAAGVPARAVSVPPGNQPDTAVDAAINAGGDRSLVVLIGNWKSDAYFNMELMYEVNAQVYDPAGNLLAETEITGRDDLGPVTFEADISKAGSEAFNRHLQEMLNQPDIQTALE